jgi:riboflavin transporter FmnP
MTVTTKNPRRALAHKLTLGGMLSALATILMFLSFNVPLMPSFIKLDFSELPALIAAYALGPVGGLAVCFVKNVINFILGSQTGGVGELANFIIGALFVIPAGFIFKKWPSRAGALVGGLIGAAVMAVLSVFTNYYIVYPVYTAFMPMDSILGMYRAFNPNVRTLWDALLWFNMPFTFIKGLISVGMCFAVFKPIERLIRF